MLPSRLIALYPAKDMSAETLATAAFIFFATYGVTDVLITDPGSNINSQVVQFLLKWFGVRLRMSVVGRHQSNLVERSHRETLRFLSTLVHEERMIKSWAKPQIIIMNSEVSSETSLSPFEYVFGSVDAAYFKLPPSLQESDLSGEYLKALNENLEIVRNAAKSVQEREQLRRLEADPDAGVNTYKVGDMVLVDHARMGNRKSKLAPRWSGPYYIDKTYKADITCRHIVTGKTKVVHMENLKPFFGSPAEAYKAAMVDDDQYLIKHILGYTGDPERRSSMSFLVLFEDGDQINVPYNQDLVNSLPFQRYCESLPQLSSLLHTVEQWKRIKSDTNSRGIQRIIPGQLCYVDLRAWGWDYFSSIGLPDVNATVYVVTCRYVKWTNSTRKKIDLICKLFNQRFEWSATDVDAYGRHHELRNDMILVDGDLCAKYPKILEA